jgi:RNA polymerase sigma factor (sigma-70 family)
MHRSATGARRGVSAASESDPASGSEADFALLEAWRSGDRGAGEELFLRYYDAVDRFFANKVREAAEDLVQQTFHACVEGRDRLRRDASFRSYLFGIAHNLVRAHFRRQRREAELIDFGTVCVFDLAPGPSTVIARRRDQARLLDALRRIPLDYQVVLELRIWEGLRTIEIAAVIGVPHGTARSRVRRARELLAQALGEVGSPGAEAPGDLEAWRTALRELPTRARPDGATP